MDARDFFGTFNLAGGGSPAGGFMGAMGRIDPHLLSILLGETGAALSEPGSWGQALGATTAGLSRGVKFAEAATKERAERKAFMDKLLQMLGGGLTPKEEIGPTSFKVGPETATLEMTPPRGNIFEEMFPRVRETPSRGRGGFLRDLLGPW